MKHETYNLTFVDNIVKNEHEDKNEILGIAY